MQIIAAVTKLAKLIIVVALLWQLMVKSARRGHHRHPILTPELHRTIQIVGWTQIFVAILMASLELGAIQWVQKDGIIVMSLFATDK